MKILVTGSSGFIGYHYLTPRLEKEYEIHHLKSDLLDFKSVADEVHTVQPDQIVHLAARTEVEKSFYEQTSFSQVNYVGTVNLIEQATKIKHLKNFVFASTMEVFGWQPISDRIENGEEIAQLEAFNENTQPNPNAPYAVAKYACEKYLQYAHRAMDLPFTALRLTNCYGRKDNNFFVTEQIISQMLTGEICNLGYKEPYRNFIYIDDMIDAWSTVISNPDKCNDGKIFTLGPNNALKIEEFANIIAKKLSWNGDINWNTKPKRPGEIFLLNSDYNLIYNTLGWKPKIDLETGLDKTIEILKK